MHATGLAAASCGPGFRGESWAHMAYSSCARLPAILVLLLTLCSGCKDPPLPGATVAIVGIDGGDWDVFDHLIEQGRLSNLERMRAQGATSRLDIESPLSPESWTSLATGQPPDVHKIIQGTSPGGIGFFAQTSQLQVKRIWDMAGEHGKQVLVVDYWVTEPAYPVNGVMIAREGNSAYPTVARRDQGTPLDPTVDLDTIQRLGLTAPRTGNMRSWMSKARFDLLVLPIYAHDQAMHQLWAEYETVVAGVSDEELAKAGPTAAARARQGYEIVAQTAMIGDRLLGEALDYVGDSGYVMLVSDHGHERAKPRVRRIALSRTVLDGGQGTVERGSYTIRTSEGNATAVLTEREIDGGVPVPTMNFKLRYPEVRLTGTGAELARARLLALTTADGKPLLAQASGGILRPSDALLDAARVTVGLKQENGYSVFVNSGAHGYDDLGVFGLLGPGVISGELPKHVASVDATPTALWLMGLPVPLDIKGSPATFALDAATLESRPVTTVETYEDGSRPWDSGGSREISPEEYERLKELGYVE